MKILKNTIGPNNKARVIVELDIGEELHSVKPGQHYKLGYPVEEVVGSHILSEMVPVVWCSASQEWVAA